MVTLMLALSLAGSAEVNKELMEARTVFVVSQDDRADSQRVAACLRQRLPRVTRLLLADTREQADVIARVRAHLPSTATKAVVGILGGSPSAHLSIESPTGSTLWSDGAKYRRSLVALTFPGEDTIACGLANDMAESLRDALRPPPQPARTEPPILVFVGAPERGGFIDTNKGIQDSISDLDGQLREVKGVALVHRDVDASVTVIVAARGVGSEPWGERVTSQRLYSGVELVSDRVMLNTWWVTAVLSVTKTGYRKEFVGSYTYPPGISYFGGSWTECAKRLGNDIGSWIAANHDRLKELQQP